MHRPISEEIKQLRELQKSQGQTVESLVKQLRDELIEPVVTRLDQSAELTKEASIAVTNLKNELGGISQSLAGAVETIQSFQQDTLIRLQEFAVNLQSILSQFRTDTQGVMEQVAVEIQQAVNQSITGMEAQRTAFEASANQASQTFKGIREDLQAALDTQAEQQKQMLQNVYTIGNEAHRVERSYQNMTEQFNEALSNGNKHLNEYLKQANEAYTKSIENADKAAADVCSKLNETSHGLMSVAEFLVSAANNLKNSNGNN